MAAIVIYDPVDVVVPDRVTAYFPSANTPSFDSEPNKLVNPDVSTLVSGGVPVGFWKRSGSTVIEMSQGEKDAIAASLPPTAEFTDPSTVKLNIGTQGTPTLDGMVTIDRGSSTDANIKWDETDQKWKYGLFGQERNIPDPFLFEVYEAGGGQNIAAGPTIVDLDSTRDSFTGLLLTGNQILVDGAAGAGKYLAIATVGGNSTGGRTRFDVFIAINGTELPGTRGPLYARNATTGGSACVFAEVNLVLNDTLDMRVVRIAGGSDLVVGAGSPSIILMRVDD